MSLHGNTYQGLAPDRKLELFLFEAERFLTSIIGYSKLLSMDARKPPLGRLLSSNFEQSLNAIQETGSRFVGLIQDVRNPEVNSIYQSAPAQRALVWLISDSIGLITILTGYSTLLEMEVQKSDLNPNLPRTFRNNLDLLQTAVKRLSKTREELSDSMK